VKQWLFEQIHRRNLIYNQCWEDPTVDKQALNITATDRIVMITSAGCNALEYLLSTPQRIDCVDLNPHQTALLEIKLAAIRSLPYEDFFAMFGEGRITGHREIYTRRLRPLLGAASRRIWDKRIHYFDPAGRGLYFHGTSGLFARFLNWRIDRQSGLRQDLDLLQSMDSLERQSDLYRTRIAAHLWSPGLRWLLRRQVTMSMLGVPAEQVRQIHDSGEPDLSSFIQQRVDRVFTEVPIANNYFWRVYINGKYTRQCCPNYLRPENFDLLRTHCSRIHPHTMSLTDYLRFSDAKFSVYVLLDHMDWLATSEASLRHEWRAILETARPGARIIYRSGGTSFDHIPPFAMRRIEFQQHVTSALHGYDRVGTYGSFYLANIRI
jgi:S-adenosylmethionine-diacylglycerol 3-amino-3-carboxypropyl transferase